MNDKVVLTQREHDEIKWAMLYRSHFSHGTAGHNQLRIIAKLAEALGFELNREDDVYWLDGPFAIVENIPGEGDV